ncbi:unnamed protein product, partial [Linum tenue]
NEVLRTILPLWDDFRAKVVCCWKSPPKKFQQNVCLEHINSH